MGQPKPLPDGLPEAIGDAVHGLRTTLDYLAWELVCLKLGYRPERPQDWHRQIAFPIYEDPDDFQPKKRSGELRAGGGANVFLSHISSDQRALVEMLQPFGQPKHALAVLATLDNLYKHRYPPVLGRLDNVRFVHPKPYRMRLSDARVRRGSVHIKPNTQIISVWARPSRPYGTPTDDAAIHAYVDMCLKRSFPVVFGQGSLVAGREVQEVLRWLRGRVTRTTNRFKRWFPI